MVTVVDSSLVNPPNTTIKGGSSEASLEPT